MASVLEMMRYIGLLFFSLAIIIEASLFRYNLGVSYNDRLLKDCWRELLVDWLKFIALNTFYALMLYLIY